MRYARASARDPGVVSDDEEGPTFACYSDGLGTWTVG